MLTRVQHLPFTRKGGAFLVGVRMYNGEYLKNNDFTYLLYTRVLLIVFITKMMIMG